jgi:hypothetical protein
MRQAHCSSDSVIVIETDAGQCSDLEEKMSRMERNLEILEQTRQSLMLDEATGLERQRLFAEIEAKGCNEQPVVAQPVSAPIVNDGTETIRVPDERLQYQQSQFVDLGGASSNGSFRTMCVRTCDGGYFPISSHASSTGFRRDAQVCSMMCPGTETELYYHPINGESADMRSAETGRRYDDLPNAYRFRTESKARNPQCGCNFSLYYGEMLKREAFIRNKDVPESKSTAITWSKPELRGGLKAEEIKVLPASSKADRDYDPAKPIRIIGPRFLPDDRNLDFSVVTPDKTPTGAVSR